MSTEPNVVRMSRFIARVPAHASSSTAACHSHQQSLAGTHKSVKTSVSSSTSSNDGEASTTLTWQPMTRVTYPTRTSSIATIRGVENGRNEHRSCAVARVVVSNISGVERRFRFTGENGGLFMNWMKELTDQSGAQSRQSRRSALYAHTRAGANRLCQPRFGGCRCSARGCLRRTRLMVTIERPRRADEPWVLRQIEL